MHKLLSEAVQKIRRHRGEKVTLVSHMDADGICAAAIMSTALDRMGVEHRVNFVKMLYLEDVEELEPADLTIFTDLGSSQLHNLEKFSGHDTIILDHHAPEQTAGWKELTHLNAHHHSIEGTHEISGAGMAYLLAGELGENADLSALAVIGAIGDVQDAWGKLTGKNREIADDAVKSGLMDRSIDLLLYGRHTRSLPRALQMFTDPLIPGISNSPSGCTSLLRKLGIPLRENGHWRRPADLSWDEKRRLATELISRAYDSVPPELTGYVPGLIIGETYTLKGEEHLQLRGAEEFATCLNSTARQEHPEIGLQVAKGDRKNHLRAALDIMKSQRKHIAKGMESVENGGLKNGPNGYVQYFDATGVVRDTLIGTLVGVVLGSGLCDPYRPLVGMVSESGFTKMSGRCSRLLFLRGLDIGRAFRHAARAVGGEGGGHTVACGARVPEGKITEFLIEFEKYCSHEKCA